MKREDTPITPHKDVATQSRGLRKKQHQMQGCLSGIEIKLTFKRANVRTAAILIIPSWLVISAISSVGIKILTYFDHTLI